MNDNDLRQILENVEVKPSARCWEAIEGNLAAGAGATAAGKAAVGKSAAGLTSTATKTIIGSIIGVVAAGAITTAVWLSNKQNTQPSEKVVATTEQVNERPTENTPEIISAPETDLQTNAQNAVYQQETAKSSTDGASSLPQNASITQTATIPQTVGNTSSAPQQSPTPTTVTPQKVTLTATHTPKPNAATSSPTTTSSPVPSASRTEDPVLANHNEIEYVQPVSIEIPNVFTPNGDGFNDIFVIKGIENCEKSRLLIKNRMGAVIFQTSNYQNNWNADNIPDGTYYYQFSYSFNGIMQTRNGTLTIMR